MESTMAGNPAKEAKSSQDAEKFKFQELQSKHQCESTQRPHPSGEDRFIPLAPTISWTANPSGSPWLISISFGDKKRW